MNTAKQNKQRTLLIGIAAFLILVIVGGLVLKVTGTTDDPFMNMSDIVDMRQMLAQTQQSDTLPQVDTAASSDLASPPSPKAGITWSASGEVLYDLWFICATTAIVIVCSYLIKWLVKSLSRKRLPAPSPAPANHSRTRRQDLPVQ